jgi:hypothetical protein
MIGFLFGLAVGVPLGFLLGCIAMAGSKLEREMDQVFLDRKQLGFEPEPWVDVTPMVRPRKAAGVRVCACIGDFRGPHYINPDCPFHGGAA